MPIKSYYYAGYAAVQSDGSVTEQAVYYTWDGTSQFVRTTSTPYPSMDAQGLDDLAKQFAFNVQNDLRVGTWPQDWHVGIVTPVDILVARVAVEKGYVDLAATQKALQGLYLDPAESNWAFDAAALPSSIPGTSEQSVLAGGSFQHWNAAGLTASDFIGWPTAGEALLNPSFYVDQSKDPLAAGMPWYIAPGADATKVIADAWMQSSSDYINAAAAAIDPASAPGDVSHIASASSATSITTASSYDTWIEKAYIAFFLRPAEPGGFKYYADMMSHNGGDIWATTQGFGLSPEYLETYAGMNTAQRIDAIYMNLFNRHAEPAGIDYWGSRLDSGVFTINNIAISILIGAQNEDLTTVNNRVSAALTFTKSLNTTTLASAYDGQTACMNIKAWLGQVTSDSSTVQTAVSALGEAIKTAGAVTTTHMSNGDVLGLSGSGHDAVVVTATDAGKLDTVNGFAGGSVDLSTFHFSTLAVKVTDNLSSAQTAASATFFSSAPVVIEHVASDTYLYVDVNKDGAFDPAADAVVHLVGYALAPTSVFV